MSKTTFYPGRFILAGIPGQVVTSEVRELILKQKVLGFTLFKRNFADWESLKNLVRELRALASEAGYHLLLAIDQEGGRVFRLPEPFTQIPPMRLFGDKYGQADTVTAISELGQIMGSEIARADLDLDFAPVVDVDLNPANPIIGDRSFSSDPAVVSRLALAFLAGLEKSGIAGCLKHFPGHGATEKDSHLELPYDSREWSELLKTDLLPYTNLLSERPDFSLMTAHVLYTKIDPEMPATLSSLILQKYLRDQLGFSGIIFSDDLRMNAIRDHWGIPEAARLFFQAGGDICLICDEPEISLATIEFLREQFEADSTLGVLMAHAEKRILHYEKSLSELRKNRQGGAMAEQELFARNRDWIKKILTS